MSVTLEMGVGRVTEAPAPPANAGAPPVNEAFQLRVTPATAEMTVADVADRSRISKRLPMAKAALAFSGMEIVTVAAPVETLAIVALRAARVKS
jgi:hypothetical protein